MNTAAPKENGNRVYDLIGIGIGPFNLGLAALLESAPEVDALFLDRKPQFQWHAGMLLDGTTLQVPFLADLVTMADPTHRLSFLNYLKEQGRLYHFYFLEKFQIPRQEYNHYCQWAAGQLDSCRFGEDVTAVRRLSASERSGDGEAGRKEAGKCAAQYAVEVTAGDGSIRVYYTRDLILGVGSVPSVGEPFRGLPSEDVFHSAQFMERLERCRRAKSVTVVGSGQSAAEVFLHLLEEQPERGYKLDWFTRSPGFFPMEYSKLGLEHFSPDYTQYFYGLPQEQKDDVRSRQHLLYKGISAVTIAAIYDRLYDMSVGGARPPVRLLAHTEVRSITPVSASTPISEGIAVSVGRPVLAGAQVSAGIAVSVGTSAPAGAGGTGGAAISASASGTTATATSATSLAADSVRYRLDCCHREQGTSFLHDSEAIVFATGYAHPVPTCLEPLHELVEWDAQGRYFVEKDYRLKLREPVEGRIFVQNGELHTHGVGAPDLGLGAFRNSVILNAVAGRVVYPVSDRNVFQQFGAR